MEWINEKAKTLKQGAIRAMFDRANTMTGVISLGIGEPDMPTPKLVCEACKEALDKGITHYTPNAGTLSFRPVSYTHLDVYKRQGITRWFCNTERLFLQVFWLESAGHI